MLGRGTTLALVTTKRVLAGSDICEFGQNSADAATTGSCGYIVPDGARRDGANVRLYPIALPLNLNTGDIMKVEAGDVVVVYLKNGSAYATGKDRGQYCTDEEEDGLIHVLPDGISRYWQETVITNGEGGAMNNVGYALVGKKLFVCQDHDMREATRAELADRFGTRLNQFDYIYEKTYIQRGSVHFVGLGAENPLRIPLPSEYAMQEEHILWEGLPDID